MNSTASPMKVAYILHRFPSLTETFIMNEMYWLKDQGIDVQIFSLMPPKDSVVHDVAKKLLPVTHSSPWFSVAILRSQLHFLMRSPLRYVTAMVNVLRQTFREPKVSLLAIALFPKSVHFAYEMQRMQIDHIHAHFVWLGGISASVVHQLLGTSYSLHPHAFGLFQRNQRDARCELELASYVVTVSTYHERKITELCSQIHPDDIHIVNYGIDTQWTKPASETENFNAAEDRQLRILTVGRPIEKKGHEYLIEACAQLVSRGVKFRCEMMVGKNREAEALQKRVDRLNLHEHVTLLDYGNQQEVLRRYQQSDIFALACVIAKDGDRDGMPLVLIEAMACGLPIVTCPVSGITDLVLDGENGLLATERDAVSFGDALERLIEDPALRRRLGHSARQTIVDRLDIRRTTSQLANVFRRYHLERVGGWES